MEGDKKTILVTWDFTVLSEYALEHAVSFSKTVENHIALIHIVKKDKEIEEALVKLNSVCEEALKKFGIKPTAIVKEGTIFTTIGETATELDANLVIMGTHGIRGMQKLTGSWALKVIVSSKVPFVVIQAPPSHDHYNNIVFPVDFKSESREKVNMVIYLAKYYKCKIRVIKPLVKDEGLVKRINNNILFTKKILDSKGVDYDIFTAETDNFADETIGYSQKIDADIILIMTTKDISFKDYVLGANEQQIIANTAKIPVMCVNPREDIRKLGGFN